MSTDMRNSIRLWAGALALFGLFWAVLHFDLLSAASGFSPWWIAGIAGLAQLLILVRGLRDRRATNPDHPSPR